MFGPKDDGVDVHGVITKEGARYFNEARVAASDAYHEVYGRTPTGVSDADVIEYLARGARQTKTYFQARKRTGG